MKKVVLISIILLLLLTIYFSGFYEFLTFENIKTNLEVIKEYSHNNPVLFLGQFMAVFILITSLSIPGAIVLTLLSGTIFGVIPGTFIVLLSSTIGATISFLYSRYIFGDVFREKFRDKYRTVENKFNENGTSYLFTLRMIPVSPFVVINILMGLTPIRLWNYVWITFVGMIPGTLMYVYAGKEMAELNSPSDILTLPILLLFLAIAFLPYALKRLLRLVSPEQRHYGHR